MLLDMMDELKLVSCGRASWPRAHADFATHGGDSVHVRANVTWRLGNLQVANKFEDGEERFANDWLR